MELKDTIVTLRITGIRFERQGGGYRATNRTNAFSGWGWSVAEARDDLVKDIKRGL